MKVTEYFKAAEGRTLMSFEILPPLKGGSMADIFKLLDILMEFKPPFIDVTYHREEYVYTKHESGYYEKTAIRKRPGTVGICAAIMHKYGVEAVPHLICGGFTREDTENALIDLNFLNIKNVLALRGDAMTFEEKFNSTPGGHAYALDLVKQITDMNAGKYLDPNIEKGSKTDFCIGVAGYPEKHFEAPNIDYDLHYAAEKIKAGADYIVTQMYFDNQKFFSYVKECRAKGIEVPIVPGIKPLTKRYQLSSIPRKFFVNMPDDLVREVNKAQTDADVLEIGIEWSIAQCRELLEAKVPCIHFYTMGDVKTISKIIKGIL
ncbi:MAG TPA: methylenetetrahydrofolate reductase [NAD(P)H] [Saprospiraceae bacterium]|nr:methylenetetrahydrofolate reductase [NAD(P)H] [Saprospiraceae bacterium]